MASIGEILARARVITTQMGGDANMSPLIDNKSGLYALLRNSIRYVYRKYAGNQKFFDDINVRHPVTITTGAGTLPDEVIREFLHQAQFEDATHSLITYQPYSIDFNSGQNYAQLGYVNINGGIISYRAPAPVLATYSGSLFITVPSIPTLPDNSTDDIDLAEEALEDIIVTVAKAIRGEVELV